METRRVTLHQLTSGSDKAKVSVPSGRFCRIVVERTQLHFVEFDDALFRFNSAVLLPETTATGAKKSLPGLNAVASCLLFAQEHPRKTILIAGNTDTVGSDAANVELSKLRAQAVHGILSGKRTEFAHACFGPHLTQDKKYPSSNAKRGVLWDDYTDVLTWASVTFGWPCTVAGNPSLWNATKQFQKYYNASTEVGTTSTKPIKETGLFDEPTWGAVYDCYEVRLAAMLEMTVEELGTLRQKLLYLGPDFTTCGEFKPVELPAKDNYRSQTNRRVEVLFFPEDENHSFPCFAGACDAKSCLLGNTSVYKPHPIAGAGGGSSAKTLAFHLRDEDGKPMGSVPYRLSLGANVQEGMAEDSWVYTQAPPVCTEAVLEWGSSESGYAHRLVVALECTAGEVNEETEAQNKLHNLGYSRTMPLDEALTCFQSDEGLSETGRDADGSIPALTMSRIRSRHNCV